MEIRPEFTPDADGYYTYMSREGKRFSEGTERKWMPVIRKFDRIRKKLGLDWSEINDATVEFALLPAMIDAYCALYKGKEPSANTLRGWWDALHSYFEYLHGTRRLGQNFMNHVPKPSYRVSEITHLLPEEDVALARCAKDPLEAIVIGLLREVGLRSEEAAELQEADVNVARGQIEIRAGKTDASVRTVFIPPSLSCKINAYRLHKKELGVKSARFLATKRTGKISSQYIWVVVKRVAARAHVRLHGLDNFDHPLALDKGGQNVSDVSPHVLRKTYGMDLINSGVELAVVSDLLGHAHQRVTEEAYARPLKDIRKKRALQAASAGPYGTEKALDDLEKKVLLLPVSETGRHALFERIDSLMASLQAMRAAEELLAA